MSNWSLGGSLGRSAGKKIDISSPEASNSASQETQGHPLLSTPTSSYYSGASAAASTSPGNAGYAVSYQPRLSSRTASTTSSTVSASSASSSAQLSSSIVASASTSALPASPSSATSKLQVQNLQAEVQKEGLRPDSYGFALLLAIMNEAVPSTKGKEREKEEWDRFIRLLEDPASSLILLLAKDPTASREEATTAAFLSDHLLISSPHSNQITSLSGLRGHLSAETIYFQSVLPPTTSAPRASCCSSPSHLANCPSFSISSSRTDLSIPRSDAPPPTLPRTNTNSTTSRLASLFAGSGRERSLSASSATKEEEGIIEFKPTPTLNVHVHFIDRAVKYTEVVHVIGKANESTLRRILPGLLSGVKESGTMDKVINFVGRFEPKRRKKSSAGRIGLYESPIGDVSHEVQQFYEEVRESLGPLQVEGESDEEMFERFDGEAEKILEGVEELVMDLMYDRLFCPASSTDEADDESLAERIAGLNLLELSLENLGLDIGHDGDDQDDTSSRKKRKEADLVLIRPGLEAIAKACGQELKKLEEPERRSPRDKLEVIVQMHKIIVDRLGQLPPIPMKEDKAESAPVGPSGSVHEMTDDSKSLGGRSRPHSPEGRTPRASSRPSSILSGSSAQEPPEIVLPQPTLSLEEGTKTPLPKDSTAYFDLPVTSNTSTPPTEEPTGPTSSSADLILPILIYSVVQANPQQLASHLAFVQRFRAESLFKGEGQYCLVNAQAVLEFLLTVDLSALGLSNDRILSANELSPLPPDTPIRPKNRMTEDLVGHVSSTINSVSGVVDGGYKMLGSLLSRSAAAARPRTIEEVREVLSSSRSQTREGLAANLFRRASEAPFLNATAKTVDVTRNRSKSDATHLRSGSRHEKELQEVQATDIPEANESFSARSVTSLSNMMTGSPAGEKLSIGDRLASLARFSSDKASPGVHTPGSGSRTPPKQVLGQALSSFSPSPSSRPSSLLNESLPSASLPRRQSPATSSDNLAVNTLDPPIQRLLQSDAADLRLGDVAVLLADYKRLAKALESRDAFS